MNKWLWFRDGANEQPRQRPTRGETSSKQPVQQIHVPPGSPVLDRESLFDMHLPLPPIPAHPPGLYPAPLAGICLGRLVSNFQKLMKKKDDCRGFSSQKLFWWRIHFSLLLFLFVPAETPESQLLFKEFFYASLCVCLLHESMTCTPALAREHVCVWRSLSTASMCNGLVVPFQSRRSLLWGAWSHFHLVSCFLQPVWQAQLIWKLWRDEFRPPLGHWLAVWLHLLRFCFHICLLRGWW
jgi:hypothetical protein